MKDRLKATEVKAAKPGARPRKLHDGGGLYLLVTPAGARYWRFKYLIAGREKLISLGTYPERSLEEARRERDRAREIVRSGGDPSEQRKRDRAAQRSAAENTLEFVAREWFAKSSKVWAKNHATKVIGRLEADIFPRLGSKPIARLTGPDLLAALRAVEERGAIESAHRIRQYLTAIYEYGIATHRCSVNPTPRPGALAKAESKRMPAITDPKGIGALMRAIRGYSGSAVVRAALQLAPLVFARPGELRSAQWSEIDLTAEEWRIPAERMKMKRAHVVPLAPQVLAVLRGLQPLTDPPRAVGVPRYVFPSERGPRKPISENTLNAALRTCGFSKEQVVAHGFRHMASTVLHESGKFRSEVIERQLAHVDKNSIRGTYNSAEYMDERRLMMRWWADRLDALASSDVVGVPASA